jgi:hypothetical protein
MKFYKDNRKNIKFLSIYNNKIINDKLSAILHSQYDSIIFYKNGLRHNSKNAAYLSDRIPDFWLNNNFYGSIEDFTKESWRKFTKLQAFL